MELCRLCILRHSQHINIFSSSEPFENVADWITQHIGEVRKRISLGNSHSLDLICLM